MTIETADRAREKGVALVYVGIFLVPLLLCTGLAIDLGRGYLVRATLAKAVDAAALAAARNIATDTDQAKATAKQIFDANFPAGFLGVRPDPPRIDIGFGSGGAYVIAVSSTATLPTTFMRLARFDSLRVAADAQATRRLVDMAFVIDRSGSLGGALNDVKKAANQFVEKFNQEFDRIALITFSAGTTEPDKMGATRGFNLKKIQDDIDSMVPSGPTATAEALYQAWDQLRSVPAGAQSGLRIVVLFTDGTPNAFPGRFQVSASKTGGTCSPTLVPAQGTIISLDYPAVGPTTTDYPYTLGLYDTGAPIDTAFPPTNVTWQAGPNGPAYMSQWDHNNPHVIAINPCIPHLPARSSHSGKTGAPSAFDLYDSTLHRQRKLIGQYPDGTYPNHVQNANNAARNLAEIIANQIRSDRSGSTRIRIYTLGLGDLLLASTGSALETGESILRRIANDPNPSDEFNPDQLDGKYFFAGKASELQAAFDAVSDEVWRLSQ